MNGLATQIVPPSGKPSSTVQGILRRKCECGNHTMGGEECEDCRKKKQKPGDQHGLAGSSALARTGVVQSKLAIGSSCDPVEHEADLVADQVLAGRAGPSMGRTFPRIRTAIERASRRAPAAPASVDRVLAGPGEPLGRVIREDMEQGFGRDFSRVRVHTDWAAQQSARELKARAYTAAHSIVFGAGQYSPATVEGRRLIAHELTHVVQQSSAGATAGEPLVQRRVAIGELPPPNEVDFNALADQAFEAMEGWGTDEEAVYGALEPLRQDPGMINTLIQRYAQRHHGADLVADIYDDFSGTEREYALQLLGRGHAKAEQQIAPVPEATADLQRASERLRAAVEGWGTDEEAIYATLLPFNRATEALEQAYQSLYGESLRARLIDEMSGSELAHALALLSFNATAFIDEHFEEAQRPFARKILSDILAVRGDRLDFADDRELAIEISKRMRTSQLMKESQATEAFDYPESCTSDVCPGACRGRGQQGTPDYVPPEINFNAHVNRAARNYWVRSVDRENFYTFELTDQGKDDPYQALVSLFTPQESICDKTLIHCDYLTTVIHLRAFAESIGPDVFKRRVKGGEIKMILSYNGFQEVMPPRSPAAISLQYVRPASEEDLLIGDHVIFWNHLAYDALTNSPTWFGPWRLENALLVDQDASGRDLYEGHGAPVTGSNTVAPGDKAAILRDMVDAYNRPAEAAIDLTRRHDAEASALLHAQFPRVVRDAAGNWVIAELDDRPENARRPKRFHDLRPLTGVGDPDLIGLRDPDDPSQMGWVKRPVESAPGRSPSRPK